MSTQAGNLHDSSSNAYSSLPPSSFIIGSESEQETSPRDHFANHHPIPSEMGLRYMTIPESDDARYSSEATPLNNPPLYSVEPHLTSSTPSSASFFTNIFPPALSSSSHYTTTPTSYIPSSTSNFCLPDIKHSFNNFGGGSVTEMQPPARSPPLPQITSPISIRDSYASNGTQYRRHSEISARSPPSSSYLNRQPMSPTSSSGFTSPLSIENAQLSNGANGPPPLKATEHHYSIQTSDGQSVRPEIIAKIDKGFFLAENDWTCYRRNYFQLTCSYTLSPSVSATTPMLLIQNGQQLPIQAFAMSISAVVDGENGKKIDLVQHTPKRDKGPQLEIQRIPLLPRAVNTTLYNGLGSDGMRADGRPLYDPSFAQTQSQPPTEHTFERIQFKQATANNGKRRARQQYYHLIVELYVDLGAQMNDSRWVKIARRVSAPMVVRGRSPGHYHVENRGANPSGSGGANGQNGGMGYNGSSAGMMGSRNGDGFGSASSSLMGASGYGGSYSTSRSVRYLAENGISIPAEPIMSAEEEKSYTDSEGYRYYPHTLFEANVSNGNRAQLPPFQTHLDDRSHISLSNYATNTQQPRVKQQYSNTGYNLPSLTGGPVSSYGYNCGRFEGVPSSRNYYPPTMVLSQINSS